MIYQIKNKYYVRVAPMKYTEVKFVLEKDEVVIKTTGNKLISNADMEIKEINFQQEKEKIKANLLKPTEKTCESTPRTSKYRRRA